MRHLMPLSRLWHRAWLGLMLACTAAHAAPPPGLPDIRHYEVRLEPDLARKRLRGSEPLTRLPWRTHQGPELPARGHAGLHRVLHQPVRSADFRQAMQAETSQDLGDFFARWVDGVTPH